MISEKTLRAMVSVTILMIGVLITVVLSLINMKWARLIHKKLNEKI